MRSSLTAFSALCLALLSAGIVVVPAVSDAATAAGQVVTVQAATAGSTTARLDLWQLTASHSYQHVLGPITAHVGELGVGRAAEGVPRTPAGVFGLTQAFGNRPSNGTKLPYFQAGPYDWWNGQVASPAYNTHVRQVVSPGPASENLYTAGAVYAHAVVIDYNRFPVVKGAGSAFFFHVTNGQPTAGCVAVLGSQLDTIMRWLNPAQHPVMSIGVGAQATALISTTNAAAATHNPIGFLESSTSAGSQKVRLQGWAADPDNMSAALGIHVYVDGHPVWAGGTGVARPDVARVRHAGPKQGYNMVVPIARGTHVICAYAMNIATGSGNPRLGCKSLLVT
jgi:L,D-peptidoglycan transpeptidase YkuD (ErfK/YbiS/YcfS/YnhG family)